MFEARSRAKGGDQFTAFLKIAADTDWSAVTPLHEPNDT
jgi:hypothetical protein